MLSCGSEIVEVRKSKIKVQLQNKAAHVIHYPAKTNRQSMNSFCRVHDSQLPSLQLSK